MANWFKTNRDLSDDQIINKRAALEASAGQIIGDVPPMDVLNHWMENETAELLSNPQLPEAVEAIFGPQESRGTDLLVGYPIMSNLNHRFWRGFVSLLVTMCVCTPRVLERHRFLPAMLRTRRRALDSGRILPTRICMG